MAADADKRIDHFLPDHMLRGVMAAADCGPAIDMTITEGHHEVRGRCAGGVLSVWLTGDLLWRERCVDWDAESRRMLNYKLTAVLGEVEES